MQAGIIPFRLGERALNPLEIRIERALQHSGLGIGIMRSMRPTGSSSTAPFCFHPPSWSAVQRSFDIVLFGLPYVLTAF